MPEENISSDASISIGVPENPRILRNYQDWRRSSNIDSPKPQINKLYERNDKATSLRVKTPPEVIPKNYAPDLVGRTVSHVIATGVKSNHVEVYMGSEYESPEITQVSESKPKLLRKDVLR